MNCIEKLNQHCEDNPCCYKEGKIIEYEELPKEELENFSNHDPEFDFILYCKSCRNYYHLQSFEEGVESKRTQVIRNISTKSHKQIKIGAAVFDL